ncbi:hypothetical protein ACTWQB_10455 [Piscibacillus sp. B03]|uniref:hypothetical protein n=1 Tax=Piscibacillus sp. B03 TaxID=3457430 RepID=UPI003FCD1FCC
MNKIIGISILIIGIVFATYIIYNHQQLPNQNDVFDITKDWSPPTEDVLLVEKVNDEWLTIFRNQHSIMIAKLEQNWLGNWELRNDVGHDKTLASISYPNHEEKDLAWSANESDQDEYSYYFGQILNPNLAAVEVEVQSNVYEDAKLFTTSENTFFYKKVNKPIHSPVNIKGITASGEVLYSTKNTH